MTDFRDDFERFAHDIINAVTGRQFQPSRGQVESIAHMLRCGPGVTIWPRNAAEAAQQARDRFLKRPKAVLLMPPPPKVTLPPRVIPPVKMPR